MITEKFNLEKDINFSLLNEEVHLAHPNIVGLSFADGIIRVHSMDAIDTKSILSVIEAHDGTALTERQQEQENDKISATYIINNYSTALSTLNSALDNWETLSIAQKDSVLKLNTQVIVHLLPAVKRLYIKYYE